MAKRGILAVFIVALSFGFPLSGVAGASVSTDAKVQAAIAVLEEIMGIPENADPSVPFAASPRDRDFSRLAQRRLSAGGKLWIRGCGGTK